MRRQSDQEGQVDEKLLRGVRPPLVAVVKAARADASGAPSFKILEGLRTPERQRHLFQTGKSRTLQSKHLTGHAVDLGAIVGGSVVWEVSPYVDLAKLIQRHSRALGIRVKWGGIWDRFLNDMSDDLNTELLNYRKRRNFKAFFDGPHFELAN